MTDLVQLGSTRGQPLPYGPLVDTFGRTHDNLRISVTDRCNIRCFYCMPETDVRVRSAARTAQLRRDRAFRPRGRASLGSPQVRLTGGEPLLRRDLPRSDRELAAIPGIEDLALTTNGVLLAQTGAGAVRCRVCAG